LRKVCRGYLRRACSWCLRMGCWCGLRTGAESVYEQSDGDVSVRVAQCVWEKSDESVRTGCWRCLRTECCGCVKTGCWWTLRMGYWGRVGTWESVSKGNAESVLKLCSGSFWEWGAVTFGKKIMRLSEKENLHNLYTSSNIVRMKNDAGEGQSMQQKWAENVNSLKERTT
jgi:hypothetical protein